MREKHIHKITGTVLVLLSVTSLMAIIGPQQVRALTWDAPIKVPMDMGVLPVAPAAIEDQFGRVWLAWAEKPVGGSTPEEIYFKNLLTSGIWTTKRQVTGPDNSIDTQPFVTPLANGTIMILWSSNRTGNRELFYRLYQSVSPVSGPLQLTNHPLADRAPSAVQDRKGRIWVAWEKSNTSATPIETIDIYYKYFDGVAWSADFKLPVAMSTVYSERAPTIAQTKDGRIWIVWASDEGGGRSLELYASTTDGMLDKLPLTGVPWSARQQLTSDTKEDDNPTLIQARDGTLWVFWQRDSSTDGDVLFMNSLDNGATWGRVTPFASTTDTEGLPAAAMMSDKSIWVFWNIQNSATSTKDVMYSKSSQITGIHDVGVSGLNGKPVFLRSGTPLRINATVSNYGDFPETTTLTVTLNSTVVYTQSLSLLDGDIGHLIQITYPTTLGFWGRYVLKATIQTVTGEIAANQGDNNWTGSLIRITPPGDLDFNGVVDILDAASLAIAYGSTPGSPTWNPEADIDRNGVVDILDAAQVAFFYGKSV